MAEGARLNSAQRLTVTAAYLGWTLDAFDFFLMVFLLKAISESFGANIKDVSEALFLTLAAVYRGAAPVHTLDPGLLWALELGNVVIAFALPRAG